MRTKNVHSNGTVWQHAQKKNEALKLIKKKILINSSKSKQKLRYKKEKKTSSKAFELTDF